MPAPSPFAWPLLLGAASMAFPAAAALYARRSLLRDPAGQIAGTLLLLGLLNLVGLGQVLGTVPRQLPVSAIHNGLLVVLLAAPLLRWLGVAAPRHRLGVQLALAALWVAGAWALGAGREFGLVAAPVKGFGMSALCAAALARSIRHPAGTRDDGRFPVLGALLTYFFVGAVARPLIETLFASDPRAMIDAHMGTQLVYAGCLTMVAWGMTRRPAAPVAQRAAAVVPPPVPAAVATYPAPRPAPRHERTALSR